MLKRTVLARNTQLASVRFLYLFLIGWANFRPFLLLLRRNTEYPASSCWQNSLGTNEASESIGGRVANWGLVSGACHLPYAVVGDQVEEVDPRLSFVRTPLSFEPNVGQDRSDARFTTRGTG